MMAQVQKVNKIVFSTFICFSSVSCTAQKININHIVDTYIAYYTPRNKIFNPSQTFLQIGINQEEENPKEKNIFINNNCFDCMGKVDSKDLILDYKGYKVVILYDNNDNKKLLLANLKNTKPTNKFSLDNINDNIINDVGIWTFSFDENLKVKYFCNTNRMENMKEDTKEIKQKLGIDNTEDCISAFYK